jgi:hypothetical protein
MPNLDVVGPCLAAVMLVAAFAPFASAQPEDDPRADLQELVRQIRRNMVEVEKDLDRVAGKDAREDARATKEKLDELVQDMKDRGAQITKDIDAFIKSLPPEGAGGGGGGGGQSQPGQQPDGQKGQSQARSRDRNKPENQGQPKPKDEPGRPQSGKKEDDTARNPKDGHNRTSPPRPDEEKLKAQHLDIEGRWGMLPPELRQKLQDRNFQEFTPEYQEEIKAYYRKLGSLAR